MDTFLSTLLASKLGNRITIKSSLGPVAFATRSGDQACFSPNGRYLPVLAIDPELSGGVAFEDGFSLELTTEGWNSPILHLADTTMENSRIWGELPKLFWCASVEKAKEGSIVLATHPYLANRYGKLPLILTQRYGAGKVLMINIDST